MSIRRSVREVGSYSFTAHDAPVKLDQNESPWPLPEAVRSLIAAAVEDTELNRYPDLLPRKLINGLARHESWDEDGITVAGGSNVLIQALVIVGGIGRTVLSVSPTFSVYELQGRLLAREARQVPLSSGFGLPVQELLGELDRSSGVLFIANPAAPTGNLHPRAELKQLREAAAGKWLFVIDEAYRHYSGTDFSDLARGQDDVVVLRTLSKAGSLAGARLGYALAGPELTDNLRKVVLPFSVSALQEKIGLIMLEHRGLTDANVRLTVMERQRLELALSGLPGVQMFPSQTNFVLFRVADAGLVHARLLEGGILVRRQDHLPGLEGCLRVSVGLPEDNVAFLDRLTAIMNDSRVQELQQ